VGNWKKPHSVWRRWGGGGGVWRGNGGGNVWGALKNGERGVWGWGLFGLKGSEGMMEYPGSYKI